MYMFQTWGLYEVAASIHNCTIRVRGELRLTIIIHLYFLFRQKHSQPEDRAFVARCLWWLSFFVLSIISIP